MRIVIASVLAATLAASTALAGDNAVLPAGKPAGVQKAEIGTTALIGLVAVGALVGVMVGVTSGGSGYQSTFVSTATSTG